MIELLPPDQWKHLEPIYEAEWGAATPDPTHGMILTETDDGELVAFVTLESVMLVSNVYIAPNHRGAKGVGALKRMMKHISDKAQGTGRTFVMIGHEDRGGRYAGLFKALGLRRQGEAWRKRFWANGG